MKQPQTLLFLGAGASKAFGIGDLSDLTTITTQIIRDMGYGDLLAHIYDTLIGNPNDRRFENENDIDIEVILSILDLLTAPELIPAQIGISTHYIYTLAHRTGTTYSKPTPSRDEYNNIRTAVEEKTVESCNSYNFRLANEYYSRLFTLESSITPTYVNALNEHPRGLLFKHIVTTNYDLVLERYDLNRVAPPKHSLQRALTTGDYIWNEPYLDLDDSDYDLSKIQDLKLHGSIDWWIRSRDNKVVARESPTSLVGETYLRRQMIYPVYDKHVSEDPSSYLFNYFRKMLNYHDVYVVIGFSFRDSSINNAFRNALNRRSEARMVIVNRTPQNIRNNIMDFPNDKLDVISRPFGNNELLEELCETLNRPPRGRH